MLRFCLELLVACIAAFSLTAPAYAFTARVVGVHDGDTVTVLTPAKEQIRVRLAEIDAPELDQPFGMKAKQMLSALVFGKDVAIQEEDIDRYGRTVGRIYQGDIDVNLEMVKQGGAWAYRKYLHDDAILQAETAARAAKAGLWALQPDQIMPPWDWRHGESHHQSAAPAESDGSGHFSFACGGKMYCRQMSGCAEAEFYLHNCGLARLDGDHDGIPCESLCR